MLKKRGDSRTESRIAAPLRSLKNVGLVDRPDAISRMLVVRPSESTRLLCQSVPPKTTAVVEPRRRLTSWDPLLVLVYVVGTGVEGGSAAVMSG